MLLNLACAWMPYALLVEIGVLCITLPMMLLQAVFVYLRFKRPDMPRPFKVPGNKWVALLWCLGPAGMTLVYTGVALAEMEPVEIFSSKVTYMKVSASEKETALNQCRSPNAYSFSPVATELWFCRGLWHCGARYLLLLYASASTKRQGWLGSRLLPFAVFRASHSSSRRLSR